MGTIASATNWSGREVAGIVLGEPATDDLGRFVWDHPMIPAGTLDDVGRLVVGEVGKLVEPRLAPKDAPLTATERKRGVEAIVDGVEMAGGRPVKVVTDRLQSRS